MRQLHCVLIFLFPPIPPLAFPLSHFPLSLSLARTWKVRTETRKDLILACNRKPLSMSGWNYFETIQTIYFDHSETKGKPPVSEKSVTDNKIELNTIL